MGKLHINILDTSFTIQADEDEEYLKKLLNYYEKITEDIKKIPSVKSPLQNSILAGIMLCDELYKEKSKLLAITKGKPLPSQNSEDEREINSRTLNMIDKINKVL
ncbi:MAG: cell division protein ZapA [Treponema sp.]|nr:cell division protein ZapA [Treponema sp.]